VIDKSKREDGTFSREDFVYDEVRDIYTCPAGKTPTTTGYICPDHAIRYLAVELNYKSEAASAPQEPNYSQAYRNSM
jgi:hypothetical protein